MPHATPFKIYLCGPTLYSQIHVGNARSLVLFDVIAEYHRRTSGVIYARNITDVDDKIIALSNGEHPGEWVARNTLPQYLLDQGHLGIKPPDHEPRASDYIQANIALIEHLLMDGHASIEPDGVYMRLVDTPTYGTLSGRTTRTPFVLWKFIDDGTFVWESPWGAGRPGWHTECASMISNIFTNHRVDLHGGGNDLIFPHHENENIQCQCVHHHSISDAWLWVGSVRLDGQKMAKSTGNIKTVAELAQDWSPETLRTMLLMSASSKPIDITLARLQEAETVALRRPEAAWMTDREWSDRQMELMASNYQTRIS